MSATPFTCPTARAAAAFGLRYTLSTMSICSLEDIAEQVGQPFWFQLYVMRDRAFIEQLIERAKAAGVDALVLTLDLQILGQRHKDLINSLSAPPKLTLPNTCHALAEFYRGKIAFIRPVRALSPGAGVGVVVEHPRDTLLRQLA
jgi:isopentenyl diphosphate isomerase/L-lactate dehydrogenase-like FMN-dependent dehydrogenase